MKLRRQFEAIIVAGALLACTALALLAWSVQETRRLVRSQEAAVAMAREVTGLLVLTHEYLLHAEPRARDQWLARYRRLEAAHEAARRDAADLPALERLAPVETLRLLPQLFGQLQQAPPAGADPGVVEQRRALSVDRLLTIGQALADNAYGRERDITTRRNDSERVLMVLALAGTGLLGLLFVLFGVLTSRRVLRPLARIRQALLTAVPAAAAEPTRPGRDEMGALAERFDRLAEQLDQRDRALHASQALLRLVIDQVPAMIGYWDREGRNRLANADYQRWFGKSPEQIQGRHFEDLFGPELYAKNKPFIERALAGQRQEFDRAIPGPDGITRYSHATYVPDVRDGRVEGFVVLVTDISQRIRDERALADALAERETLLKEVYHRVKNNLQVVQSLLSLQGHAVADAGARDALDDTAQRVRALALVHEHLYQTPSLAHVSLASYVPALLQQLGAGLGSGGRVRLDSDVAQRSIEPDAAVPLGLLITELVVNSFKHAFADGRSGRVTVRVQPQDGGVRIAVIDDGCGLPAAAAAAPATLGRQLAASLAQQLGGELHFEPTPGGGTTAWVQVPSL